MRTLTSLLTLLLLALGLGTGPKAQPPAPPAIPPLDQLVSNPGHWYAGTPLVLKVVDLWKVVGDDGPRTLRVTTSGGKVFDRVIYGPKDSRPFEVGPPEWSDDSVEAGLFPPGPARVTLRIELFKGVPIEGWPLELLKREEVIRDFASEAHIDALCPQPFCDRAAAAALTARLESGGIKVNIPEPLRASMAVRVRLLSGGTEVGSGAGYYYPRNEKYGQLGQWNDPANFPIPIRSDGFPQPPYTIEIVGDPTVALRAGFSKYWVGRVLIPVK